MTAVEWLHENNKVITQTLLDNKVNQGIIDQLFNCFVINLEQAKEMEKEQLHIARLDGINLANKGYGSKRSVFLAGYEQIDQNNPVTWGSTALVKVTPSQTEISDEEIKYAAYRDESVNIGMEPESAFIDGAKWYREELRKNNEAYGKI